jgi:hypothetical protein
MTEMLISQGWKSDGKCNCGNTLTLKFKKDNYLIKWQKKKQLFKAYEKGKIFQNLTHEKNIYTFLQSLHQEA